MNEDQLHAPPGAAAEAAALDDLAFRIRQHIQYIYPGENAETLCHSLMGIMGYAGKLYSPLRHHNHWDQSTAIVITYGNSITAQQEAPLHTLKRFAGEFLSGSITTLHILPFYPYSSDDGFAVIDYTSVNPTMGSWEDIQAIGSEFDLMADLVINHCSSRSLWFENYKKGVEPGAGYFVEMSGNTDLSAVTRPRATPILHPVQTLAGERNVWTTFGPDQVDLDFRNPEVLLEVVRIIRFYLDQGVRVFRLDAVAFLWKQPGTCCLNLPETHEIVRLLRTLVEHAEPGVLLITETNIPNRENLAYFGNANEAHMIYNFSLPPLLVHSLLTGSCQYLKSWMMSMPPAQAGTAYFNFIASHDGIGLRPAEGLLEEDEIDQLVTTIQSFGGRVSWRALEGGESRPYEMNISLYDALKGTVRGEDRWNFERFICAHAIMLALEGVPAFYIHSLLATGNDYHKLEHTSHNRSINRHSWDQQALLDALADPQSRHARALNELKRLLAIRALQPAFHPNATQYTLQLGDRIFAFWRQSQFRDQSIFVLSNISSRTQSVTLSDLNMIDTEQWRDLISGAEYGDPRGRIKLAPYQTLWISNKRYSR